MHSRIAVSMVGIAATWLVSQAALAANCDPSSCSGPVRWVKFGPDNPDRTYFGMIDPVNAACDGYFFVRKSNPDYQNIMNVLLISRSANLWIVAETPSSGPCEISIVSLY